MFRIMFSCHVIMFNPIRKRAKGHYFCIVFTSIQKLSLRNADSSYISIHTCMFSQYRPLLMMMMAAWGVATARGSPIHSSFLNYTRSALMEIRKHCLEFILEDKRSFPKLIIHLHKCLELVRAAVEPRPKRYRHKKQGKWAGCRARLRRAPHRPAVPS